MQTKEQKTQTLFEFILSKQVQALITGIGLLVLIGNLWLVSKLSPLANSINSLEARADDTDTSILQFVPRRELELILNPVREDLGEIKTDVKEIKAALNRL